MIITGKEYTEMQAEISRLKAEIASKERQFQDYVTRMTDDITTQEKTDV
jgi:hypothetical protein